MNISHLLLCTSLLSAPVCTAQGPTEIETETPASSSRLPAPLAQKIASGDFDGLQTELRSTLLKAGEQTKSEPKLLQNKQYRHLLDIHELLRVTGPDKVKAVFSKSAQDAAFIKTFLQDPAWMELYLGAGLIPENSPEGLQILSDIWKADGKQYVTVGYIPTSTNSSSNGELSLTAPTTPTKYMDYLFQRQSGSWYLTGLTESETKPDSTASTEAASQPQPMAESDVQDAILATAGSSEAASDAASDAAAEPDTQSLDEPAADSTAAEADAADNGASSTAA